MTNNKGDDLFILIDENEMMNIDDIWWYVANFL